ncbi:MAG: ribose-phosphate diphosphokinase [Patescibacteria group bacterium]|jgi:ribose-phosphate pyrophosphokinase
MLYLPHPAMVLTTTGSDVLAQAIAEELKRRLPTDLQADPIFVSPQVVRFSNDNIQVQVPNVRGHVAVIVHTQVPPVNDHLVELFELIAAARDARAYDIMVVFPYMPYARSDRKNKPRISTMGVVLPQLIENLGVKRVLLLDPHDTHIKHYFRPGADEISAVYLLIDYLQNNFFTTTPREECTLVFSDEGSSKRFGHVSGMLKIPTAHIDKTRLDDTERPKAEMMIGDVRGRTAIIIDDEILTGRTVEEDVAIIKAAGAAKVIMIAIHAPMDDIKTSATEVINRLERSAVDQFIVTDSIPIAHKLELSSKIKVLSVAGLLAEAINREVTDQSLTELHQLENAGLYR